jgi:hypothetical protein
VPAGPPGEGQHHRKALHMSGKCSLSVVFASRVKRDCGRKNYVSGESLFMPDPHSSLHSFFFSVPLSSCVCISLSRSLSPDCVSVYSSARTRHTRSRAHTRPRRHITRTRRTHSHTCTRTAAPPHPTHTRSAAYHKFVNTSTDVFVVIFLQTTPHLHLQTVHSSFDAPVPSTAPPPPPLPTPLRTPRSQPSLSVS